jgi:hypothetical protein
LQANSSNRTLAQTCLAVKGLASARRRKLG